MTEAAVITTNFITPTFLISYDASRSYNDYRSVVDSTGTQVIFERVQAGTCNEKSTLQLLDIEEGKTSTFLTGSSAPLYSTRPDWCWNNGNVAFSCVPAAGDTIRVGYTTDGGTSAIYLPETEHMIYPTWFPPTSGTQDFLVMNSAPKATPDPNTSLFDIDGNLQQGALAGSGYWAGMPAINQAAPDLNLIAFAGQPVVDGAAYEQNYNYIWILDTSKDPVSVTPLEAGVQTGGPFMPQFQGRAPWWSPDGNWIVFESNRAHQPSADDPNGLYAIFLYEVGSGGPAIQITDPIYNCNHAKWFPSGTKLVVAAYQPDKDGVPAYPWGLASLDISSIVGG